MKIILRGTIPPKKNSRVINFKTKRSFPSKRYQDWHKSATVSVYLQSKVQPKHPITAVSVEFYMPDNRRRDMTNVAESIMDLLVDCKIIEDDCWQVIPMVQLRTIEIDKENPRAEITLYEQKN